MSKLLELLQEETARALSQMIRERVSVPHMLTQSLTEFVASPEGAGWLLHMERQLHVLARMGESKLEYIVLDQQRLNDVLGDPMCPVQSWYVDTVKQLGVSQSEIFETTAATIIRNSWKTEPNGPVFAAQLDVYLKRCMERLEEAWNWHSDVPVRLYGHRLLFDWSPRQKPTQVFTESFEGQ
jgi:hypothetical protein